MSETIQLRTQQYTERRLKKPCNFEVVTGVELADGTNIRGIDYMSFYPEQTLTLEWSQDKAERIAEYYDRYLTRWEGHESGWNCHSFVAKVMDWNVTWNSGGFPGFMPRRSFLTPPDQLQDQRPYGIYSFFNFEHSVMGLPDPTKNLSTWGMGGRLRITDNEMACKAYGARIFPHIPPGQISRTMARLLFINKAEIPASALSRE